MIQCLLVPLSIAGFQLLNFGRTMDFTETSWNIWAGIAVLFGTYFLFTLGPRSLISEGTALWIPLTWPRGLEAMMRGKARLWWLLRTLLVTPVMFIPVIMQPADAGKVVLVWLGWLVFGAALSEKTVTLVQASSSSGEPEPVPEGRLYAAYIGTFAFAIGVMTAQWHLAIVGLVYGSMTAAAMWQAFRERLPFLFDPWSERASAPPTVLHSVIAIMAMVELAAIFSSLGLLVVGRERLWFAQAVGSS